MTWNVVHNFPASKDTYEVPINYPDVGYDTIIALWFTDVFTSILAMQDVLIGEGALFLPKAGGTMTGDLQITKVDAALKLTHPDVGDPFIIFANDAGELVFVDFNGELVMFLAENLISTPYDMQFTDTVSGPVLKAPNASYHRIKVANDGTLSTEAL